MIPNTETTNLLIQAGALGVLILVLAGGYRLAKAMLDRMFTQGDENLKFVRDQIRQDNIAREGQLKAWIDAYKEQIQVSVKTAETLAEILFTLKQMNGGKSK